MKFTRRFFIHVYLQFKSGYKENYLALTSLRIPLTTDWYSRFQLKSWLQSCYRFPTLRLWIIQEDPFGFILYQTLFALRDWMGGSALKPCSVQVLYRRLQDTCMLSCRIIIGSVQHFALYVLCMPYCHKILTKLFYHHYISNGSFCTMHILAYLEERETCLK